MIRTKVVAIFVFVFWFNILNADSYINSKDSISNKNKQYLIVGVSTVAYTASFFTLNSLWYKNYPRQHFHFFNDNNEWLQMDKSGHVFSAYTLSNFMSGALHWSGLKSKQAAIYGGISSVVYMSGVELLDGYSQQWGFSWGDISANTFGAFLYVSQALIWESQKIKIKYSFYPSKYPDYRSNLLGNNFSQQLIKDYNAQTYWASVNISSFLKKENKFPKWLNIALGYGADGLLGGEKNPEIIDAKGNKIYFQRYRQYYFSFDLDLSRINTKSVYLKSLFKVLNCIKIPFPSIEYSKNNLSVNLIGY